MNVKITPTKLHGSIAVPDSKSHSHRLLIGAALAGGEKAIKINTLSEDILATQKALADLIAAEEKPAKILCNESGSTLRFLLPLTMALRESAEFYGSGKLPSRPLSPLWEQMEEHGVILERPSEKSFAPQEQDEVTRLQEQDEKPGLQQLICSGKGFLKGGDYFLAGNISSQYVTGLLFALPLTAEGGVIHMTSPLQSKAYVELTLKVLADCGIEIENQQLQTFIIKGNQKYNTPKERMPEGDWSAAAFWIVAKALGSDVSCNGTQENSVQGDKEIANIVAAVSAKDSAKKSAPLDGGNFDKDAEAQGSGNFDNIINAENIPDLVPIIAVFLAATPGNHKITGAARLRIKESDRLQAMATNLNAIGGRVKELKDGLEIQGSKTLKGGTVCGFNDHRIVMAMAIAATVCKKPVIIKGASAIAKSYPDFFEDYKKLGGSIDEI